MTNKATHEEFSKALYALANIQAKLKNTPLDQEYVNKVKFWSASIFKIVVMGEIKKGKSSFINAMLGFKNLVPVSSDVATSTIFKICYGEKLAYRVFFTVESGKGFLDISAEQLNAYGTEDGNANNAKQVDFIQVFAPSPILKSGLVIIDTPGLGGLFKGHKKITYDYVPKADAVFMITDSKESPIGRDELELLEDIRKITNHIYFVQTKGISVDKEARLARKENNLNILADSGFDKNTINYFVVDSKLRFEADEAKDLEDLNDSGYPQLMSFVNNNIRSNIQILIKEKALLESRPMIDYVVNEISMKESILNSDTEEKRKAILDEITKAEDDLRNWKEKEQPKIVEDFQRGLQDIRESTYDDLAEVAPNSKLHLDFERNINEAQSLDELSALLNNFKENMPEFISKMQYQTNAKIQERAVALLESLSLSKEGALDKYRGNGESSLASTPSYNNSAIDRALDSITSCQNTFENAKTLLYGGMAGTSVASLVGGIIGSIIPVAGTVIGSAAGVAIAGYIGATEASSYKSSKDLASSRQQAAGVILQSLSAVYTGMQKNVQKVLTEIERNLVSAFKNGIKEMEKSFLSKKDELSRRNKQSAEEVSKLRNELLAVRKEFDSVMKVIRNA